jgi:serine/threonine-protein kinase
VTDVTASALADALGDRYTIERELGRGGMATVFLARDLKHDRLVALKVLRPELAAILGADRFLREIRLSAQLQHPHILTLIDSGETAGVLYYVMPYAAGESLRQRLIRERQLPVEEACRLTLAVASALDYAHGLGIIHRDIKPENILLHQGEPMVADFGIALAADQAGRERLTETGLSLGTPAYMSPEQATADPKLDGRSDQYSLACVLYEMLAGEPPYTGPTAQAIIAKRLGEPVPHLGTVRDIPPAVAAAVARGLAKSPPDRFLSASEFARAAVAGARVVLAPDPPARPTRWIIAAIAVLTALGIGWLAVGRWAPEKTSLQSLAVLPLLNLGGDTADAYFSDGLTDELTSSLSRVPGLLVISRTSAFALKNRHDLDIREIGRRLGATVLLEGTVHREAGRVRVTLTLTDATRGTARWSQQYERALGNVFDMQDQIVREVAKEVGATFRPGSARPRADAKAHDLYLRGLAASHSFSEAELRQAIVYFEQALAVDSTLAPAWSGIAFVWNILADDFVVPRVASPEIRVAARRSLALDSTSAGAHAALASALLYYEWDFQTAETEVAAALSLDPNNADALYLKGALLAATGRGDSVNAFFERAHAIDPLSSQIVSEWGSTLITLRQADRAVEVCRPEQFTGSEAVMVAVCRAYALAWVGQPRQAILVLDGLPKPELVRGIRARTAALVRLGRPNEARALASGLANEAAHHYVRADLLAQIYAIIGDRDAAFHWLDRAVTDRNGGLILLGLSPSWDSLRGDPRYRTVLSRVGLVEWFPNAR